MDPKSIASKGIASKGIVNDNHDAFWGTDAWLYHWAKRMLAHYYNRSK